MKIRVEQRVDQGQKTSMIKTNKIRREGKREKINRRKTKDGIQYLSHTKKKKKQTAMQRSHSYWDWVRVSW